MNKLIKNYKCYGKRIIKKVYAGGSPNKYILGILSEGFGNKLYMLTFYIYMYFKIKECQQIDSV